VPKFLPSKFLAFYFIGNSFDLLGGVKIIFLSVFRIIKKIEPVAISKDQQNGRKSNRILENQKNYYDNNGSTLP